MTNIKFDLEERTAAFGKKIIQFCKNIPSSPINRPLVSQIVRSGTSVGANYCEADTACSKKDFFHKISFCQKEAKETKYWLKIIIEAEPSLKDEAKIIWQEASELTLIFSAISKRSRA